MPKPTFPKTLYVTKEPMDGGEPFLLPNDTLEDIEESNDGKKVAVYKRVEVKTLEVKKALK